MELALAAIAAGSLVGAADQYLCLLLVSGAAKIGWIQLTPGMDFMSAWWFIAIVAVFWALTVLPQYLPLIAPGLTNAVGTVINFVSGFVVPASSALVSLASVGIIAGMHPEMANVLDTLRIFGADVNADALSIPVAGGGALVAVALNASKAVFKPAISGTTGTTGTVSAPIFATVENIASILIMGLAFLLANVDPRLLVLLGIVMVVAAAILFTYALVLLWRLKRGIGQVFYLLQRHPRIGLAVVAEFLVWGSGWLAWKYWARGGVTLGVWAIYLIVALPLGAAATATVILAGPYIAVALMVYFVIGLSTSRSLLRTLERVAIHSLDTETGSASVAA